MSCIFVASHCSQHSSVGITSPLGSGVGMGMKRSLSPLNSFELPTTNCSLEPWPKLFCSGSGAIVACCFAIGSMITALGYYTARSK